MFRGLDVPKEEDFDEVEEKIEELLLQYESISSPIEVEELMRQFASWAIDQVIPKEKKIIDSEEIILTQLETIELYKDIGFNACRQEMEENKKSMGL